jgi:hypothetical protein
MTPITVCDSKTSCSFVRVFIPSSFLHDSASCGAHDAVDFPGAPGAEGEACDFVKRMKTIDGSYTDEALAEFRQLIWKNLVENSRDIVHVLRKLNLDLANRSTKVC